MTVSASTSSNSSSANLFAIAFSTARTAYHPTSSDARASSRQIASSGAVVSVDFVGAVPSPPEVSFSSVVLSAAATRAGSAS
jgi:hypothetical protein